MKTKILTLLQQHKGKKNAITVNGIARALKVHNIGATGYPIRLAVKELIQKDKVAIGSCSQGFYLIETEAERLQTIDNLVSRQNELSSRIRALRTCVI